MNTPNNRPFFRARHEHEDKTKIKTNSKHLPRTDFISFIYNSLSPSIRLVFYTVRYYDDDDDDEDIF